MKNFVRFPKRIPTAPPGKFHTSHKGAKGYNRNDNRRAERAAKKEV